MAGVKSRVAHATKKELRVWAAAIPLMIVYVAVIAPMVSRLDESRIWRDLTGKTPFRSVIITSVTATSLEITLAGTLVKSRDCLALGAPIAQVMKDGRALPASFIAREHDGTPASRPPSPEPQEWGPWIIVSPTDWPDRARLYRTHNCGGEIQTNTVFDIPWPKE